MFLRLHLPHHSHVELPHHHEEAAKAAHPALWRSMSKFMFAIMIANLLQASSSTLTAIYVGRLIGTAGLAAIASFLPLLLVLISFLIGLATGSSILIARAFGAKDMDRVRAIAGTTILLGIVLALAIAFGGFFSARSLMELINAPADVFERSVEYGQVLFILLPILFVFVIYSTFLRGIGDSRTPVRVLAINVLLVMVFTPAFIKGWFGWAGLPPLGIKSAVFGPALANLLCLCGLIFRLNRGGHPLALNRAMLGNVWCFRPKLMGEILYLGIPTGLQMVMLSLSQVVLITFVNGFGSDATAAFGAVLQLAGYVQLPSVAIALCVSIFAAQAIGAGDPSRLGTITRTGVVLNYAAGGILTILVYASAPQLLSLFLKTPVANDIGVRLAYITMWSYLLYGHAEILTGIMRSSGIVWRPMLLQVAAIWAIEIPFAWAVSQYLGLDGIWLAYPVSYVATLIIEAAFFVLVWRRPRQQQQQQQQPA
jgi:putative MATE family efflux protein